MDCALQSSASRRARSLCDLSDIGQAKPASRARRPCRASVGKAVGNPSCKAGGVVTLRHVLPDPATYTGSHPGTPESNLRNPHKIGEVPKKEGQNYGQYT
jgi:hypothetical protein